MNHTYFVNFRKRLRDRTIRKEYAIPARTRQEARQIGERENASLRGWTFDGVN
jgi:hypothetical protein